VHRAVKPANGMIETDGSGKVTARVLDFGLAAEIRSSMGRVSKEIHDTSGTRPYMAPEQWLGGRQGPATDQYALAVLFYELVTGEVPFASVFQTGDALVMMNVVGRESPDLPSDLPKTIRLALMKALAKKVDERFASCMDFVLALEGRIKVSRADVESRKSEARAANPAGKKFPPAAVLALLAILGLAGAGVWYRQEMKEREIARIAAEQKAQEAQALFGFPPAPGHYTG
jgi:serine/threonine-protein kinase